MDTESVPCKIVNIDSTLTDQVIEFFKDNFLRHENVCIATNILGSEEAEGVHEIVRGLRELLKDGVSFAALDNGTGELIGICVNKIISPTENGIRNTFDHHKTPALKFIAEYCDCMESTFDLFKEWHINCAMEIVNLSTRQDHCERGVGTALVRHTIQFAWAMLRGCPSVCSRLPDHIRGSRPEAICSIFSSHYVQKIGEKFGFHTVCKVPNTDFLVGDTSFAFYIEPVHKFSTFAALRL